MRRRVASGTATEGVVEEVLAERATLEDDRLRLADALRAVRAGVVVVDAEGRELVRNEPAKRYHQARHAEALAEHTIGELLERARAGEAVSRELDLFGPPRRVLLVRAVPLRDDGRVLGAVAFVHDQTETRRVESLRRDFVANVSHELKTPIGALGLLAETIASSDDLAVARPLADRMGREAYRLGRIIDDLLDLSLVEAQEVPTRESVPVRVLVDEAAERVLPLAVAHGIPVEIADIAPDLALCCDPRQLTSAITNLLDNAVKYSEEGRPVEIGATRKDGRVVIEVRDHGIGIPPTDLERVFERFYRVDKARSRDTGGTGLGLAIVRHVAQVHGGEVTVESVEGEGSTFRLMLPLGDSDAS